MINVGRCDSALKFANARASIRRSFASPTRVTFQPKPMNFVAMSSLNASEVLPSMVISLLS